MRDLLTVPSPRELAEQAARFETAPASAVVRWAWGAFGNGLVLASSFQDCVLVDIAVSVAPELEVVFLDTGFHFAETMEYVEKVRRRYDLNLRIVRPEVGPDVLPCGSDGCCQVRKVQPLNEVLEGRQAWMTGVRRADAASRADAPILSIDPGRGVVKVNPLATWTALDPGDPRSGRWAGSDRTECGLHI